MKELYCFKNKTLRFKEVRDRKQKTKASLELVPFDRQTGHDIRTYKDKLPACLATWLDTTPGSIKLQPAGITRTKKYFKNS